MTPPHPRAVGSLGHDAIEWIETHVTEMGRPIRLYWWQKLAIVRQLEVDADGRLVWRVVVESCPRRAGKSVRLRVMALWRMAHAELLGEEQQCIHVARDMNIVREILRGAFDWAELRDWTVRKANGKEEIEAPDGSRWLARSVHATTGYSPGLALADECWDIEPGVIDEGLEPATMKRISPQLVLTSTAHRRATSLMKGRITRALQAIQSGEETNTLLLLWAMPPGADPSEESSWRAASPHWSPEDRDFIRDKYVAALAGQDDPDSDDPDPMEGFLAQYGNRWKLTASRTAPGSAVVKEQEWAELEGPLPDGPPAGVAIEGWYRDGVSVARAWFADGRVTVSVSDHRDVPGAIAAAAAAGCPNPIRVGKSLTGDPALQPLWHEPMQGTTKSAVADLRRLVDDGALAHDGSAELARQVLALRVSPSADGVTLRSKGRADAVKSAVWAAEAARNAPEPAAIW
jgi:hypothetical protein